MKKFGGDVRRGLALPPPGSDHPEHRPGRDPAKPDEVLDGQPVDDHRRRRPGGARLDVGYQESSYTSPMPAPADLERYQAMIPDAPERMLAAGEREQAHRHEVERRLVALDEGSMPRFYAGQRRAHAISLVLGLAYLGLMLVAILEGFALPGIAGAAAGIAAIIWATRRDPSGGQGDGDEQPSDVTGGDTPAADAVAGAAEDDLARDRSQPDEASGDR